MKTTKISNFANNNSNFNTMRNFTFWSPTKFVFGRDKENNVGQLVNQFGGHRLLIVYGGGSVQRSGLLHRVVYSLSEQGFPYHFLGGIKPNPIDGPVYEGIKIVKENNIDFILAVGGGSVIDTAKAIALGALYDGDFWDFYCGKTPATEALPIGVVLTIPAAGSEGSGNSVITRQSDLRKLGVRTESAIRPRFAVMNPELTFSLPPYQTAAGIVDMMAHIMERYFSPTEGVEVTDRISEGLLRAIIAEARRVIKEPECYEARANIMWAGTLAHNGVCGTGCEEDWSSHGIEHELSALYDVTHGAGLAVIFPAWLTYAAATKPEKIAQFAQRVFDVEPTGDLHAMAAEGIARLKDFFVSIGMPVTIPQLGVENPDIDLMVRKLHENKGATFGSYIPLTATDTRRIYQLAL